MLREPTDVEMVVINKMAKQELKKEQCMIIEGMPANDMMLTSYGYYIGTSSLFNFKTDLEAGQIPMNVMHRRDLALGNWLPGEIARMSPGELIASPQDLARAKQGKNYVLRSNLYMMKGLSMGNYSTDQLAKAYMGGLLQDVSITWFGRPGECMMPCSICGNDIRDYMKCEHIPLREYDGVLCTYDVEGAHLTNIALVDDGGLPGATLASGEVQVLMAEDGAVDWESIKKLAMNREITGQLAMPGGIIGRAPETNRLKGQKRKEESDMDFKGFCVKFEKELSETYVLKANHDKVAQDLTTAQEQLTTVNGELTTVKEQLTTAQTELTTTKEKLTAKETEYTNLEKQFGDANVELNEKREHAEIGKARLTELQAEYHRLGVVINGDKWIEETKDTQLNAMSITDREKFLSAEIAQMKEHPSAKELAGQKTKNGPDNPPKSRPYDHRQNPALYT